MDFNTELINELKEYDALYVNATFQELEKGYKISKTIKEFDSPEDFLNETNLFLLSQYYAYQNIVQSKEPISDEDLYIFDDEDL